MSRYHFEGATPEKLARAMAQTCFTETPESAES